MNKIEDLIDELKIISTLKPVNHTKITKEITQKEMKLIYDTFKEQEKLILELKVTIDKAIEYIENVKSLNEEERHTNMKWEYDSLFPSLIDILKGEDK